LHNRSHDWSAFSFDPCCKALLSHARYQLEERKTQVIEFGFSNLLKTHGAADARC